MEWIGLSLIDLNLRGKGFFFINNEMLTDNLLMGVTVCVSEVATNMCFKRQINYQPKTFKILIYKRKINQRNKI